MRLLRERWSGSPVVAGDVRLRHRARAVFDLVEPGGRPTVVKVLVDHRKAEREVVALRGAAEAGVAVPPVLLFVEGPPPVLVLGLVPGSPLTAGDRGAAWAEAGAALARLHATGPPPGLATVGRASTSWSDWLSGWLEAERSRCGLARATLGDALVDGALGRVEAGLARSQPPTTEAFVHGDFQPAHVLLAADRRSVTSLIDFGDAGRGDPAFDLAVLTAHDPHRLDDVMAGYQPDGRFHSHVAGVIDSYQLLRLLGEVPWLVEHGFDPASPLDTLRARLA